MPRMEVAGGVHHVTSRGNNHHTIFPNDGAYRFFLSSFARAVDRNGWRCLAYCLIPNHFHLLVETPQPNLGSGMKRFLGPFVQTMHRRHETDGPMFKGRFHSSVVAGDDYFARVVRYIALNPVNHGLCSDPADWMWSSHNVLLAGRRDRLVAVSRVDELLGGWEGAPGSRYAALLAPSGRFGSWADAATPFPPRPTLADLFAAMPEADAMLAARWDHGYRVYELAAFSGLSESTVSRRTRRR